MAKKLGTLNGEFIGVQGKDGRLTIWIEGRDEDGPSVSGTSLDADQLEDLISLLTVYKINYFSTRTVGKPDRRQDTRRQGDKTEKKLRELNK